MIDEDLTELDPSMNEDLFDDIFYLPDMHIDELTDLIELTDDLSDINILLKWLSLPCLGQPDDPQVDLADHLPLLGAHDVRPKLGTRPTDLLPYRIGR